MQNGTVVARWSHHAISPQQVRESSVRSRRTEGLRRRAPPGRVVARRLPPLLCGYNVNTTSQMAQFPVLEFISESHSEFFVPDFEYFLYI